MRKRVNKIISVALSATLAFGVFTALPMSANAGCINGKRGKCGGNSKT